MPVPPAPQSGHGIYVNEDGWCALSLGARDGVQPGQRFAVLGDHRPLAIYDPFAPSSPHAQRQPVLRSHTAYELLRVILVEEQCSITISDRVPPEREPQPFIGPEGELLLFTPPPADWRFDAWELEEATEAEAAPNEQEPDEEEGEAEDDTRPVVATHPLPMLAPTRAENPADETAGDSPVDIIARQQEHLWDGSLPLNAVQVGDEVILAQPYYTGAWQQRHSAPADPTAPDADPSAPRPAPYDWLTPLRAPHTTGAGGVRHS
jgi:hypothetical protein